MTKLKFYQSMSLDPYHNLAVEQCLLNGLKDDEFIIYFWVNDNAVVIGRNQYIYDQINLQEARLDNVLPVRRLSGGGAVYHDKNNLLFSFIMNSDLYDKNTGYEIMLEALKLLGAPAQKSGRNDILIDGRKFSGNAFYNKANLYCHHGTVLINTDMQKMKKYLMPTNVKLSAKGVKSVASRVINLVEVDPEISKESLMRAIWLAAERHFGEPASVIEDSCLEAEEVEAHKKAFMDAGFIFGEELKGFERESEYIEGRGTVDRYTNPKDKSDVRVFSDEL